MLGPELEVPGRGGLQLVVVADTELLPRPDVGDGHDAHDVAEPRVPELSKAAVVVEGVADLVCQTGPVVLQPLLAREDVEVSLSPAADPVVGPGGLLEVLAGQPPLPHAVEESAELAPGEVSLGEQSLTGLGPGPGLRDEHGATLQGVSEERRAGDTERAGGLVVVEVASTNNHINLNLRDDSSQAELSHVTQSATDQSALGKLSLYGRDKVGVYKELLSPVVETLSLSLTVRTGDLPHQISSSPGGSPADPRLLPAVEPPDGLEVFSPSRVLQEGSLPDPPPVVNPPHQIAPVQLLPHHSLQPALLQLTTELSLSVAVSTVTVTATVTITVTYLNKLNVIKQFAVCLVKMSNLEFYTQFEFPGQHCNILLLLESFHSQ